MRTGAGQIVEVFRSPARVLQLFTKQPGRWAERTFDAETRAAFSAGLREHGVDICAAHDAYLINLASPDDELYEKSLTALVSTMEVASAIEADGVVFHVGSHLGAGFEAGMERAAPAIERAPHSRHRGGPGAAGR